MAFDVVLIDIKLPDITGITLLKEIKKISPEISCIIITGYGTLENAVNALRDGADGYFLKPLLVEEVIKKVEELLEKRRLQQELKRSEEKYRHLFEKSPNMIVLINSNGKIIDVNQPLLDYTGYKREQLISSDFRNFKYKSPENLPILIENFKILLSKGKIEPFEVQINFNDDKIAWLNIQGSLVILEERALIQVIMQDITARKKTEQLINESEQKYRTLVETSPTSIVLLDSKGGIIDCNKTTEDLITLSKNELIGKNFLDLFILNDRTQWAYDTFRKILKGELEGPILFEFKNKEGKLYSLKCFISSLQMNNKLFLQVVSQDITAQMHAEKLSKKELENLKELDQIKNDLVQRISHELRTPLTSIYSSSQFLLNYCRDKMDDRTQKFLNIINKGGHRLKELVDNLLLTYDIESDKLKLRLQNSDIIPTIEESIKEVAQMASKRKISIHKKIHDDLVLTFDVPKIRKVITNLLFNAVQNTFENGRVQIITKRDINNVDIIIKDTGIGFIEKEKQMLFKKFGKIERYGKGMDIYTEGPGLGLYISKEIIELHRGRIWVETEGRNKGSTFIIRLPVKK